MPDLNKKVVGRLIEEHWNEKRPAMVPDLFASTVTLHTPDGVLSGLDGARFLLQSYTTAFPDFNIAIHDMISEGDQVVVRYTFTGTHRGPLADIPATALPVNLPNGVLIFRLADSKITEGFFVWNKYALLQQLGMFASAAPTGA
jgi:steroid delta-isomerase-like uncharacterized protein